MELERGRSPWAKHWTLDPEITYLNHGPFGACPVAVLEAQSRWRARLERQPVQFLIRDLEGLLDEVRGVLGRFLHCEPLDLVFVPNATTAVNAVVRSYPLGPGDEIVTTDHNYRACRNALDDAAKRARARVVTVPVPFPIASPDEFEALVLGALGPRTRLLLLDHVTSPTGLVLPVESIVPQAEARGVRVLVDGAHAPGMVPVDLGALGASFYTANAHKWLWAPKGAAFLHVQRDLQPVVHAHVVSHAATSTRTDRTRFLQEFDWPGTFDPTPVLSIPTALATMEAMVPGGWPEIRQRNHDLALAGRRAVCAALDIPEPAPASMIGSLATIPLPHARVAHSAEIIPSDPLQDKLIGRYGIEVPIWFWPAPPQRMVRIAAQLYNDLGQYERLASALAELLREEAA